MRTRLRLQLVNVHSARDNLACVCVYDSYIVMPVRPEPDCLLSLSLVCARV